MKIVRLLSAGVFVMVLQALTVAAFAVPGDALMGFGADYVAPDGSSCVHRGMDVSAQGGEDFGAPIAGTVSFAGRVPGPHGGSIQAVTLATTAGSVSLLPFDGLYVSKGESVEAGESVGRVAVGGDPSSAEPHVHIGLRLGDLYVDPSVLLAAPPAPTGSGQVDPQPEPVADQELAPVDVEVTVAASPAPTPVLDEGVSLAPLAVPAEVPAVQSQAAPSVSVRTAPVTTGVSSPTTLASGRALTADSGVSVVTPLAGDASTRGASVPSASDAWRPLLNEASTRMAHGFREMARTAAPAMAVLAFVVAAGVYLLGRRSFERRLTAESPVSNRLGRLLQQLRAGDTLRGLTSCSGHAAFTVPEPFSPGEVTK